MLTVSKLRSIILELNDDMPVLIAVDAEHAEHINSVGTIFVGLKRWDGIITAGVPMIESVKVLVVSTFEGEKESLQ